MSQQRSRPALRLLTLNVNGLRDSSKRRALFLALLHGPWDVILLQETHHSSPEEAVAWAQEGAGPGMPWVGHHSWAHGTSRSSGVAVLCRPHIVGPVTTDYACPSGTLLRIGFEHRAARYAVVCVYAPSVPQARPAFYSASLPAALPSPSDLEASGAHLLVAGDFNCIESAADQLGGNTAAYACRFQGFRDGLQPVQHRYGLVDAWRRLHPAGCGATHRASNAHGSSAARLDRWLAPATLLAHVERCDVVFGLPGDHYGVALHLSPPGSVLEGPGVWSLPLPLLQDAAFIRWFRAQLPAFFTDRPLSSATTRAARWDQLKAFARDAATRYAALRAREQRTRLQRLRRRLRAAVQAAEASGGGDASALASWEAADRQLRDHYARRAAVVAQYAGVLWEDCGEQCTAWFHRLGQERRQATVVAQLGTPAGVASLDSHGGRRAAAAAAEAFVSADAAEGLVRPGATDAAAQQQLLGSIDCVLSAEQRAHCDGAHADGTITAAELATALQACARSKRPGSDGLPYEFYATFWDDLGEELAAVVNEVYLEGGLLTDSQRTGIIVLLYKGKGLPRTALDSYRPITLLNADYKLVAKALTLRWGASMAAVLDGTQTAFLPGRWVGDNILCHLEEIDYLEVTKEPGVIIFLDFAKAYDRLDRDWLFRCMERLGFGGRAMRWARLLADGTQARVLVNGYPTAAFPMRSGVPQGSPLSPLLYDIAAQPLASHMRQLQAAGVLHPIRLPDGSPAPPTHQHADDTTIHVATLDDVVPALERGVEAFCRASNARLNLAKTKGLLLGSERGRRPPDGLHTPSGVRFAASTEVVRHLGIQLGVGEAAAAARQAKFAAIAAGLRQRVQHWSAQRLSFAGRLHVAKQTMASMLYFHAGFSSPSPSVLTSIICTLRSFVVGGGGGLHPRLDIAALPFHLGGIGYPDVLTMFRGLQAKVMQRLLMPPVHPWQAFMRQWFLRDGAWRAAHPAVPTRLVDHLGYGVRLVLTTFPRGQLVAAGLPPRVLGYVHAFRAMEPGPLLPLEDLDVRQRRLEPLFYSAAVLGPGGRPLLPTGELQPLVSAGITTVGALAAAQGVLPSLRASLEACLPAPLHPAALAALPEPFGPWSSEHLDPSAWGFGAVALGEFFFF